MPAIFRLLRPLQWLKNGFVFTPLIFSKHLFEKEYYVDAFLSFIVFCFASSLVYIINDIVDREGDKLHPNKKQRPIASGEISIPFAAGISSFLALIVFVFASFLPVYFQYAVLIYIILQLAYSFSLKHVVILDLFIIAMGFMLRVFGGAFAIQVEISHWIVITTLFLSLFLAASKRRSELVMIKKQHIETKRRVLQEYTVPFLDTLLIITTTGMAIAYSLYTMAERTIEVFNSEYLIFTTVFVVFGIFRYLFLVIVKEEGENPTAILTTDMPTAINVLLWLITCVSIIYFS
ncbi:MAG: decaprenyl-phosphate phosphoribosyltransferase [Bacteriovoracaceae bacterium]|nr:decaprenyl-phosphate phosphoribosyltransferase [Bacteroidota bacterium]